MAKAWPYLCIVAGMMLGAWIGVRTASDTIAESRDGEERPLVSRFLLPLMLDEENEGLLYGIFGSIGTLAGLCCGSLPLIALRVRQSMRLGREASRRSREKLLDALTLQESARPRST